MLPCAAPARSCNSRRVLPGSTRRAEIGVIALIQMRPFYDEVALDVLRGVEGHV